MASTAPHLEFAPPHTRGSLRALGLAILAHGVLLAVLSVGVQWKSDPVPQTFEAELWSAVPVEAAPPAPLPEPEPVPEPPKPVPPVPKPAPQPAPPPDAALKAQADIALARDKQKQKEMERQIALEREKAKALKDKKLALEKQALEKQVLEKKKLAELDKQKEEKRKKEQTDKQAKDAQRKQDQKEVQLLAEQRQKAIKRMEGLAGAGGTGAANSTSTSLESRSLSASYQGRIRAYIKRFHTYTETVSGNPVTEIEIRTASDGSILSRRITKPSSTKSWDDAALNAIDKAEKLPLDENGRAPSPMVIIWSAQEVAR